jgi:hypothetical protein
MPATAPAVWTALRKAAAGRRGQGGGVMPGAGSPPQH